MTFSVNSNDIMREQYSHCEMVKETEPHALHTERSVDQSISQSESKTAET